MIDHDVVKGRIVNLKDNKVGLYYKDVPNQNPVYFDNSSQFDLWTYRYTNKTINYNLTKGHSLVILALNN